jgi:DNA-directed RNA polymerase specialized sigma24 family protein
MARPEEPAWAGKGYPLRTHPQTFHEWLMPCAQFEALERCRQARRDRGIDSDEETVRDKTKDKDEDEDDPQEEPAPLKARIRTTTVDMFKRVLLFSQGAAEALYNNQMVMTLDVLQDLTNDIIKELCRAIRKPGRDGPGHQIS